MTASVTPGRALRYAGGSARGLLHQPLGHSPSTPQQGRYSETSRGRDTYDASHAFGREIPPIRTVHHLACTGGTVISRCLAALPNVRLLSEVDPLSHMIQPAGRFCPTDLIQLSRLGARPCAPELETRMFQAALRVLHQDCMADGLDLVLRDHAHSQFSTGPGLPDRPTLREIVADIAPLRSVVTVRHPFDSYLSLRKNGWLHFDPPTPDVYAERYHIFLDRHPDVPMMRYEDFAQAPEDWMRVAARHLDLVFDPACLKLFGAIKLSGDSGRSSDVISPRPRSPFPEDLRQAAHAAPSFAALLDRLGYEPVSPADSAAA